MEARVPGYRSALLAVLLLLTAVCELSAATFRTPNFVVTVSNQDPQFARQVAEEAERFRKELAVMWAGRELPNWSAPCPIQVSVGQIGAGGATTFSFHNGEVFGWKMNIQGTEERILDSVLPHEITHTILACRFRRPLPRWADEGMCTLVEHESERRRQVRLLGDVMRQGNKIPLRKLLAMTEYPPDMRDVMKLYAQGYSLTDYLVQQGGRETFLRFLGDAMRHGGWDQALSAHYGVNSIDLLEKKWNSWVVAGSPTLNLPAGDVLALHDRWRSGRPDGATQDQDSDAVVRGQSPERSHTAPDPVTGADNRTAMVDNSAPRFDGTPTRKGGAATPAHSAPNLAATDSAGGNTATRSRHALQQPVYSEMHSAATQLSQHPNGRSREALELTREEFVSPKTPLTPRDQVHPFAGGTQNDPFAR